MRTSWLSLLLWGAGPIGMVLGQACEDASMVVSTGEPAGKEEVVDGVTLYITEPKGDAKPKAAVLYLTDVFGIQLAENKLLADSFARAGYLTVAPDMFNGTPRKIDIDVSNLSTAQFLAAHAEDDTDAIIAKAVGYIRDTAGEDVRIGATGYCFGGRYAFRTTTAEGGAHVAFAAHPANLADDEITGVVGPASVAGAETDSMMPPERRGEIQALLLEAKVPYQFALYSGTQHGFGVRANMTDPQQKFGKESAFLQAVRWFDTWLPTE